MPSVSTLLRPVLKSVLRPARHLAGRVLDHLGRALAPGAEPVAIPVRDAARRGHRQGGHRS